MNAAATLDDRLERLAQVAGTDEGFYVLALHSFIEAYICDELPSIRGIERFADRLRAFADHLAARGSPPDSLAAISRIIQEHAITNRVRHSFTRLDREEALAATHNFLQFCAL
ncbi:MAG: hypothetical protein ACLQCB_22350, partial [Spirochaetia bacterium]